jgi:hypothetical protein
MYGADFVASETIFSELYFRLKTDFTMILGFSHNRYNSEYFFSFLEEVCCSFIRDFTFLPNTEMKIGETEFHLFESITELLLLYQNYFFIKRVNAWTCRMIKTNQRKLMLPYFTLRARAAGSSLVSFYHTTLVLLLKKQLTLTITSNISKIHNNTTFSI